MVDREHRVIVTTADAGQRADVVIARHLPFLSRRVARQMALRGQLACNERPIPPSTRVEAGHVLALRTKTSEQAVVPAVLTTTDAFVYVNKPAGIHTLRQSPEGPPTLADAVARVHPECRFAGSHLFEAGAIHRLDCHTTGVVAFARTTEAYETGRRAIRGHAIKIYLACCHPPERWPPTSPWVVPDAIPRFPLGDAVTVPENAQAWRIDAPLGRGSQRNLVTVRPDGRSARTWVVPLGRERTGGRWLVAARLQTGARHQIRVHLASLGLPICGDPSYGIDDTDSPLALHAHLLHLDPLTPGTDVCAPLPTRFAETMARLHPIDD